MATYKQIIAEFKRRHGRTVKTCWIAHVKADNGLTRGVSPNRTRPNSRKHPCPLERRTDLEAVMRDLGVPLNPAS